MAVPTRYVVTILADYNGAVGAAFEDRDGWTDDVAVSFYEALQAVPFFAGKVSIEKVATQVTDQVLDKSVTPPVFR